MKKKKSKKLFTAQIIDLIVRELGMDAHKDQVRYLSNTKKTGNIQVKKWFKRIRLINWMMPLLQGGAKAKSDVYMLESFVFENIPKDWMMQSELKSVDENTS